MTDSSTESAGSFSDLSQAQRLRDLLEKMISDKIETLTPSRRTGMILDIYQGGVVFNSDITVDSTVIPRTQDNPAQTFIAKIRCDDKWEGEVIEARIDPNFIPIFRKADFFDEDNPSGSGTMVDRSGRYITVGVTDDDLGPLNDTYPSLNGTTVLAPQAAPRVAIEGGSSSWHVSELIRGVLAGDTVPGTLMIGPDFATFNTSTLQWAGTIAFARGSEINSYEITPGAPIVTYGGDPLVVSPTEPVEITLGQRSGSMYLNFAATDGVPVLVWVESDSDTPVPPEWYLVFARINQGTASSKIVFSSQTDFRCPDAPSGLDITFAKSGFEKVAARFAWDAVTEGTNGDPLQVREYEIHGQLDDEEFRRITTTADTSVTGLTFDSGSHWRFKVRAIGSNGVPGVFSTIQSVVFPAETVSPSGGSQTYWQSTKPTSGNAGDEWFDTANGNAHYIFDAAAGDFIFAPFGGQAIADAAIGSAQISSLDVEKLTGNKLTGNFLLAGSLKTAESGNRVENDWMGVRLYDGIDKLVINLTSWGDSTFKGQVEALGLEVDGKIKINGDGEISPGADLVIAEGYSSPANQPIVQNFWDNVNITGAFAIFGITKDPANGDWVVSSLHPDDKMVITRHNESTGALISTVGYVSLTANNGSGGTSKGIAIAGGKIWIPRLTGNYSTGYGVDMVATDGTIKTFLAVSAGVTPGNGVISVGSVSGNLIAVQYTDVGNTYYQSRFCTFDVSTSTKANIVTHTQATTASYGGVSYGTFDLGHAAYVCGGSNSGEPLVRSIDPSTGGFIPNDAFPAPSSETIGIGYYNGLFWTATGAGAIYLHTANIDLPDFAYSWYDSKSAGSGLHETNLGPYSTGRTYKRAKWRVSTSPKPSSSGDDSVDSARVVAKLNGIVYTQGLTGGGNYIDIPSVDTSTVWAKAPNFPATSPARITSASGHIILPGVGLPTLQGITTSIDKSGVDANTIVTPAIYKMFTGTNLPFTPCYLEVLADGQIQRATSHGSVTRTAIRSSGTSAWNPWREVAYVKFSGYAALSANQTLTATQTVLAGCSLTVPVVDLTDVFMVTGTFAYASIVTSTLGTAIGRLLVDGVALSAECIWQPLVGNSQRSTFSQTWLITGLSAGNHTFALAGSNSTASAIRCSSPHTTLAIRQA